MSTMAQAPRPDTTPEALIATAGAQIAEIIDRFPTLPRGVQRDVVLAVAALVADLRALGLVTR